MQPLAPGAFCRALGYGDFGAEVDVLDGVEKLDAFLHRALESFTARDEAGAAGALVDHRRGHRFFEIVRAGSPTTVDQARAAHVAIRDLVAAEINRMVTGQVRIDALIKFAVARAIRIQCQVEIGRAHV